MLFNILQRAKKHKEQETSQIHFLKIRLKNIVYVPKKNVDFLHCTPLL